jgi:hypothetical protein
MDAISFVFAALIVAGILFFGAALVYELVYRLRDASYPAEVQLRRADLGRYPHWDR